MKSRGLQELLILVSSLIHLAAEIVSDGTARSKRTLREEPPSLEAASFGHPL